MPHGDSSTTFARRSNAVISPQPLPREQPGFELRIVSQPGIARRLDEAFCRAATGNRAPGSRKSTYVQAIRFPASSAWRPFARYSTLRIWLAVRHLDSPFGVSRRPPADAAQPTRERRGSERRGAAAGALVLHVLDRCPQLLRVPGRPVVVLGQPPCPGAPAGGDHPDHRALRAVVLAKGQEPPCQGDRRKFTRTAAARHRAALPAKRGPALSPLLASPCIGISRRCASYRMLTVSTSAVQRLALDFAESARFQTSPRSARRTYPNVSLGSSPCVQPTSHSMNTALQYRAAL